MPIKLGINFYFLLRLIINDFLDPLIGLNRIPLTTISEYHLVHWKIIKDYPAKTVLIMSQRQQDEGFTRLSIMTSGIWLQRARHHHIKSEHILYIWHWLYSSRHHYLSFIYTAVWDRVNLPLPTLHDKHEESLSLVNNIHHIFRPLWAKLTDLCGEICMSFIF